MSYTEGDNLTKDYSNCCLAPLTESGHCDKCGKNAVPSTLCDECEEPFHPYSEMNITCQECENDYAARYPHPLDIAEMEDRGAECFGLEPPPWKGEFSWLE